jgi:hypothetical protein
LISLETAKEKVCKSLEKFGISLEFPWKSLEILGKAWRRGDRMLNPLYPFRGLPTAVMPGLVPGIHAAKLLPSISKRLIKRGVSPSEAAAGWRGCPAQGRA